jgi:hypothetical protein
MAGITAGCKISDRADIGRLAAGYTGNGMMDKAAWRLRQQQWRQYHLWAESQPPADHPPDLALADIGAILEWLPEAVRHEERDPDRSGVRRMHSILGLLDRAG